MASLVRLLAIAAAAVIGLSLVFFAMDQSSEGSDTQVRAIDGPAATTSVPKRDAIDAPDPAPPLERAREAEHSWVREFVDDGNDVLARPFTGLVDSDNLWVERLIPAAIGLLLFGLGGLMLANWIPESRAKHEDWRETAS